MCFKQTFQKQNKNLKTHPPNEIEKKKKKNQPSDDDDVYFYIRELELKEKMK